MLSINSVTNSVYGAETKKSEGTSPSRCTIDKQQGPGRHQTTWWTKEEKQ